MPGEAVGWQVSHTYQTSSFNMYGDGISLSSDKPAIGPSLNGIPLPSYKVTVEVAWQLEVQRTWYTYRDQFVQASWKAVDLREFGFDAPYLIVEGAHDLTPYPPGVPKVENPYCIVPVPVIESQGLLSEN
jgi:hypothetical protein